MSLLLAGSALAGGLINSAGAIYGAKKQRDWQADMANTAHQREVHDLLKAGLNPILSATGGRGAPTPQVEAVNPGQGIGQSVQHAGELLALDMGRLKNETSVAQANTAKAEAERRNIDASTIVTLQTAGRSDLLTEKIRAEIAQAGQATKTASAQEAATRAGIPLTEAETKLKGAQYTKTDAEAQVIKIIGGFITRGGQAIEQLVQAASTNGPIGDAAYDIIDAVKKSGYLDTIGPWGTANAPKHAAKAILNLIMKYAPQVLDNLKPIRGDSTAQDAIDQGRGP